MAVGGLEAEHVAVEGTDLVAEDLLAERLDPASEDLAAEDLAPERADVGERLGQGAGVRGDRPGRDGTWASRLRGATMTLPTGRSRLLGPFPGLWEALWAET
ncbi:MAG: hypothetical protein U0167_14220 [bacterium]